MALPEYTLKLPFPAVQLIADQLKKGAYNDVAGVLNEIASQVARQDHDAEQSKLQQEVAAAAASLPQPLAA